MTDQNTNTVQPTGANEPRQQSRAARRHADMVEKRHGKTGGTISKITQNATVQQPESIVQQASTPTADPAKAAADRKEAIDRLLPGHSRIVKAENGNVYVGQLKSLTPGVRRALWNRPAFDNPLITFVLKAAEPHGDEEIVEVPAGPIAFMCGSLYPYMIKGRTRFTVTSKMATPEAFHSVVNFIEGATKGAVTGRDYRTIVLPPRKVAHNVWVYKLAREMGIPEIQKACIDWFQELHAGQHVVDYSDLQVIQDVLPRSDPVFDAVSRKVARYMRDYPDWNTEEMRAFLEANPDLKASVQSARDRHTNYLKRVEDQAKQEKDRLAAVARAMSRAAIPGPSYSKVAAASAPPKNTPNKDTPPKKQ